jgi:hypothetical protein
MTPSPAAITMNNSPLSDSDQIAVMPDTWNPSAAGQPLPQAVVAKSTTTYATAAKSSTTSYTTSPTAYAGSDDDDDDTMTWERDGWVPRMKSGKQKTPNVIRGELQRYIDQCKADGSATQTRIIETMGINNNTFR